MNILILEDDENRIKKFRQNFIGCQLDVTKYPEQANRWLQEKEYDCIFLDCDLAPPHYNNEDWNRKNFKPFGEDSGICTARFLGEHPELSKNATVIIHSLNPNGRDEMRNSCIERNPSILPYDGKFFEKLIIS